MSNVAIRVKDISKMYHIGAKQEKYSTLRDAIAETLAVPYRRMRELVRGVAANGLNQEIWALKNIDFEVKHGDVVGIIGRNGAGKSTLLKILSRITEPTTGYAEVYGRVGALLEVGTGFHPELTGRENIFLNGAILGMSRGEIKRKFDEIVDFAGVEMFIDTPVKHYSSGMGLRLGFAVAAHLEPEILIVDEVLAVGDAEFQRKCLGKMGEVAGEGRTVMFVSHNMPAVRSLCSTGFLLQEGTLGYTGNIGWVLQKYQESMLGDHARSITLSNGSAVSFSDVSVNGRVDHPVDSTKNVDISFRLHLRESMSSFSLFCMISDSENELVIHSRIESLHQGISSQQGNYLVHVNFPALWLRPGTYTLQIKLIASKTGMSARYVSDSLFLDIIGNNDPQSLLGRLTPPVDWSVIEL